MCFGTITGSSDVTGGTANDATATLGDSTFTYTQNGATA